MSKLNIEQELATRKYKQTKRPFYWFYRTVMKIKYKKAHPEFTVIDDINKCDGPAFVIFNHLSRLDHIYTNEITYPRKVNMLAGYSEFYRSHLHWVFKLNNVLPKKNYATDLISTKAMISIIKKGGCISFSPEGLATNDGMNKPIVPKTGHMLKHFGIPVYFVKLRGQYLQNTKVCLDERYGKTYATISLLFSKEDLEKLSVEEIDDKINEAFRHDEYEWQKEQHIKWNMKGRACYRLEDILYRCPKCGQEFTLKGEGDTFKCTCGNGATVDDYYDFHPFEGSLIPKTPSEWVRWERINVIKEIRSDENYSYSEHVKLGRLPNDHYLKDYKTSEIVGEGMFTVDHSGVHYVDDKNAELNFDLDYKKIYTVITELDSSYFNFYVNGAYTDIFPEKQSMMKFNLLIEEMHRLHVNIYKNFKWNDYMYEEDALDKIEFIK